jgi:hypothetical protein
MDLARDQAPDKVDHQQLKPPDQVYCRHGGHPMRLSCQGRLPEAVRFRI